jgi:hypothetical protein
MRRFIAAKHHGRSAHALAADVLSAFERLSGKRPVWLKRTAPMT